MEEPQQVVAERVVRELLGLGAPSTSNANITISGTTHWQLTSAMVIAVAGAAFGLFGMYTANDTRNQARADQIRAEQAQTELRQDIKAIRAYINAGMVQPKK